MNRRIGVIAIGAIGILLVAGLFFVAYRFFSRGSGTITVWTIQGNEQAVQNIASLYQRNNPGFRIKIVPITAGEYEDKALYSLASQKGTSEAPPPDVWIMPNEWMAFHRNKLIAAPDGVVDNAIGSYKRKRNKNETTPPFPNEGRSNVAIIQEDYASAVASDVVSDNKVWGVPVHMDTLSLFYDKSKVSAPPKTWQEMADLAKRSTQRNGETISRSTVALGDNESVAHFIDILSILMLQSGTSMVDQSTRTAEFNIAKTGTTAPGPLALDFYTSFARPNKETYTWNKSLGRSLDALKGGRTAMALGYFADAGNFGQGSQIVTAPLPQTNPSNPQTYGRYLIATVTKQATANDNQARANAAWDFAAFFANPDVAEQYSSEAQVLPARKDVAQRIKVPDAFKPFLDQVPQAVTWPKQEVDVANASLNEALELVLKRSENPQVALDVATKTYTAFLRTDTGIEIDPAILSVWQSTEDGADYTELVSDYAEDPIKRVVISKHSPDRFEWEILNAMAARLGPDVLLMPNDKIVRFAPTLYNLPKGLIPGAEETESETEAYNRVFVPAVAQDNSLGDKFYGVPLNLETLMVAYNSDLFNTLTNAYEELLPSGLSTEELRDQRINDEPFLWEDYKKLSQQLGKRNGDTVTQAFLAIGTGNNTIHSQDLYAAVVRQFGGGITDPDNNVTGINLPNSSRDTTVPGKEAEDLIKSFSNPVNPFYTWNSAFPNSLEALADGKVVAAFVYPRDIKKVTERNPLIKLNFWPLPQRSINEKSVDIASYYSFTIPLGSRHPNPALQFLTRMVKSNQTALNQPGASPIKDSEDIPTLERQDGGDPQQIQRNSAQSYYKGYFPEEFDQTILQLLDKRISLDQAANRINQSLKRRPL